MAKRSEHQLVSRVGRISAPFMKAVVSPGGTERRTVAQAEIAAPLNAIVAAPTADDCPTLIYRRPPAKRAPESFASMQTPAFQLPCGPN